MEVSFLVRKFWPDDDAELAVSLAQRIRKDPNIDRGYFLGSGTWDWNRVLYMEGELAGFFFADFKNDEDVLQISTIITDPRFKAFNPFQLLMLTLETELELVQKTGFKVEAVETLVSERDQEMISTLKDYGFFLFRREPDAFSDEKNVTDGWVFRLGIKTISDQASY